MSISNFLENAILDAVFNNTSLAVASVFVKLHSGDPGEAGTTNAATETTRKAATFGAAASGAVANDADITWTLLAASETLTHISLWDNLTVGNHLWYGPLGAGTKAPATATAADVWTSYGHGFSNNDRIELFAIEGATLPTGSAASTLYHVVSATTDTFSLSATQGGAAINLTTTGEAICQRVVPVAVLSGQTFTIPTADLIISLD